MGKDRSTENLVRPRTATWKNVAKSVEEKVNKKAAEVGSPKVNISDGTVRHCVKARHPNRHVAAMHKPIANVTHRKYDKASAEWNIAGHASCSFVKRAICTAIEQEFPVLHWDDHAVWKLCGSTFTKMPVVQLTDQHKTAPYSDATPNTGKYKCVSNVMLFYLPQSTPNYAPNAHKYEYAVHKVPFAVTRVIAERRSTPTQQFNDLELVFHDPILGAARDSKGILYVSDGGWDHSPTNSEVQLDLTLDLLKHNRLFTCACCRCAKFSSYNEAERVNGICTKSCQKSCIQQAVFLPGDTELSPAECMSIRRRRFQDVLCSAIAGGTYAGELVCSLVSYPGTDNSETYSNVFRASCRVILDGSKKDVPTSDRQAIENAMRYRLLHHHQGQYHFQLRRTSCMRSSSLGRLCEPTDYRHALSFKTCSEMGLQTEVQPFLGDATLGVDGQFLNATEFGLGGLTASSSFSPTSLALLAA